MGKQKKRRSFGLWIALGVAACVAGCAKEGESPFVNPGPSLVTISPSSVASSGPSFTLTVEGTNFVSASVVQWNGSGRPTTYVSSTRLSAAISDSDIAAIGTVQVAVSSPAPGGGVSNPLTLTIGNPVPSLTNLSPSEIAAGEFATLVLSGSGFIPASVIRWNGSDRTTTFVSSTSLFTDISPSDVPTIGTAQVTVFNPGPAGGTSNSLTVAINNPIPQLSSVTPSFVMPGGPNFTLTASGFNFRPESVVRWNGSDRATTVVSSNQLQATILASDIAVPSTALVTIFNPPPGGGTSFSFSIDVGNPVPVIFEISPPVVPPGAADFTLAVFGDRFVSDSVVQWNGASRPTTFSSRQRLSAAIPASDLAVAGTAQVTVSSPSPGGGTSNTVNLAVAPVGVLARVSVDSNGAQTSGHSSSRPSINTDGRFVAFVSAATNLVPNDTNLSNDVFVRDTCAGAAVCSPTTVRVSVASDGSQANNSSSTPSVSADGRFVAFASAATNLVPNDTNLGADIFLRDTCLGAPAGCLPSTVRISVGSDGSQISGSSSAPSVSADGRFVAFTTPDPNLSPNDTSGNTAVFVRDTCFGAPSGCLPSTVQVSLANDGSDANGGSSEPSISADGRFVAFSSRATNLGSGPNGPGNPSEVFLRDTCHGASSGCVPTTLALSFFTVDTFGPSISADGRFVAFTDDAITDLFFIPGTVWVRDTCLGAADGCIPSLTEVGLPRGLSFGGSFGGVISADGRFVVFSSFTPWPAGDTNGVADVFVRDTCAGSQAECLPSTSRASVTSDNIQGNQDSLFPAITTDGRLVAFVSDTTNFVADDTNNGLDVFLARTGYNPVAPVPALVSLSPQSAAAGSGDLALTVTGTNFVPGSVVRWNGSDRVTIFVSATKLLARIPASDLAAAGSAQVVIFNPSPGGGTSSALSFIVNP